MGILDRVMRRKCYIAILGCIMIVSCAAIARGEADSAVQEQTSNEKGPVNSSQWIAGNAEAKLPVEKIPELEIKALGGSAEAAGQLFGHYMFGFNDRNKALYWLTIQAENGSFMAAYNLGNLLTQETDGNKKIRAVFWLKKAEGGDDGKASLLAKGVLHRLGQ